MSETISLSRMIPIYRRDSTEITGAVRMDAAEMIGMEQMPGGRVQVMVRSGGGAQYYLTPVLANIFVGQAALEAYRSRLGGEEPMYPVPSFLPESQSLQTATFAEAATDSSGELVGTDDTASDPGSVPLAAQLPGEPSVIDRAVTLPLQFRSHKSVRRSRRRHSRIARHHARFDRYRTRTLLKSYALTS